MSTAVTIRETGYELTKPADMLALADALRGHIKEQKLYSTIQGRSYPHVEAWQFAGACLGLLPIVESCEDISTEGSIRYRATVRIVDMHGVERGRGVAICTNAEPIKRKFDEYAIASMAQTRAVGKAYRLCIGWLLKTAGYEATPAEEMEGVFADAEPKQEPKHTPKPSTPGEYIMPEGNHKGQQLQNIPIDTLEKALKYYTESNTRPELCEAIRSILADNLFGETK